MRNSLPNRLARNAFRYSLMPLAWYASGGIALAAPASTPLLGAALADITVQGAVTDLKGEGLPGVNVILKGSSRGTVTDAQGRFSLKVPDQGSVLVFSFVGFTSQEVTVSGSERLSIKLEAQDKSLDEVVVVGYGTQSRATVTGAISQITSEELVRTPATTTTGALAGRIPGLLARQTDGRPGNGTSIQIRNLGAPLYVIDGIQSEEGQFNNLGINDIESISVLKDASAAIYGMRAANGVILVTTKRGKLGKPVINISGYYGLQNFTKFPRPATAYQFLRGKVETEQNQAQIQRRPLRVANDVLAGALTREELEKWRTEADEAHKNNDYYKMNLRPNVPQYYLNASIAGANDNISYFLSGSYVDQSSLIQDNFFKRYNLQANLEAKVTPRFRIGTQIYARAEFRHNVGLPGDDNFAPFLSVFSMWPTETAYANNNPAYINQTHLVNLNPATFQESVAGYADDDWRAGKINAYAQYDFGFGLTAKATGSYNYTANAFDSFEYTYNAYRYNPVAQTYDVVPGGGNQSPYREIRRRTLIERTAQFQLNYNKQVGDHSLSATAVYERYDTDDKGTGTITTPPNNIIPVQYLANINIFSDGRSEVARAGYVGRVGYNYKQKYLLDALARYDGSWLFAPGSRFGFFPAVTAGYRLSEEPFFKNSGLGRVLTELKLRGSYGVTGSDPGGLAPYSYYQGYDYGSGASVFNGVYTVGVRPRGLPITTLSWVRNETTNLGLNFGLLGGKLSGSFDVFARRRNGLPGGRYDVLLPNEVGYVLPPENLGDDVTRGLEGGLTYASATKSGFTYSIGAHATLARLFDLEPVYKQRFGNSIDRYRNAYQNRWSFITWGYEAIGQFQTEAEIASHPIDNDGQGNRSQLPGDIIYRDVNGDGRIDGLDERPIGNQQGTTPMFSFGINTSLGYKGFTLNFDIIGAGGQTFRRDFELLYPYQNNGNSPTYILEDRWHRADPYNSDSPWVPGKHPAIGSTGNNFRNSTFWLRDMRYLRLRNVELGYNLPKAWLSKVSISGVRVYVNATNLLTFSTVNDLDIDPEIASGNGLVYPPSRLFNTGFSVNF